MGFKENLKMLRKAKGMTQKEFGKLINKTLLTVSRYENGAIFPTQSTLKEISKIFDISENEIMVNVEYENKKYSLNEIIHLLHQVQKIDLYLNVSKLLDKTELINDIKNKNNINSLENEEEKKKILKLLENQRDIEDFIYKFSLLLKNDLIKKYKNIKHDDKIKLLENLKKYYLFLISNSNED